MKKRVFLSMALSLTILFSCLLPCSLQGAELSLSPELRYDGFVFPYQGTDWTAFVKLRNAVIEGDVAGIDEFYEYGQHRKVLSNKKRYMRIETLEDAASLFSILDEQYIGVLEDFSSSENPEFYYIVQPYFESQDNCTVETAYRLSSGKYIEMKYRKKEMPPLPDSEPLFSMKTTDGEDVPFYYIDDGINAYHYSRISVGNGYLSLTIRGTPDIKDSERIEIVKFSEMTAIPVDYTQFLPYVYLTAAVACCMIILPIVLVKLKKRRTPARIR